MNSFELQNLLDNPGFDGIIKLPGGEYEGPFTIKKPCTVIGNGTTLWSGNGCILTVKASGVTLKNMRIEITNDSLPPHKNMSVYSETHDTKFENIEVIGNVAGIKGEEKYWGIPKVLSLGRFPSERSNVYTAILEVPVKTELIANFYDVTIKPSVLKPGRSKVNITTGKIRSGSFIYGEILLKSSVIRRIYLSGSADDSISETIDGTVIFEPQEYNDYLDMYTSDSSDEDIIFPDTLFNHPDEQSLYSPDAMDEYIIRRGQHVPITASNLEIDLICTSFDIPMDIDTYAFILNREGYVNINGRFVFFGNDHSPCGGIKYLNAQDKRVMFVNLKALPTDVSQVDMVFSIYDNAPDLKFSMLKNPAIRISGDDGNCLIFPLSDRIEAKIIVGVEIKRKDNSWELTPLGMAYKYRMEELCDSYGVKVV